MSAMVRAAITWMAARCSGAHAQLAALALAGHAETARDSSSVACRCPAAQQALQLTQQWTTTAADLRLATVRAGVLALLICPAESDTPASDTHECANYMPAPTCIPAATHTPGCPPALQCGCLASPPPAPRPQSLCQPSRCSRLWGRGTSAAASRATATSTATHSAWTTSTPTSPAPAATSATGSAPGGWRRLPCCL